MGPKKPQSLCNNSQAGSPKPDPVAPERGPNTHKPNPKLPGRLNDGVPKRSVERRSRRTGTKPSFVIDVSDVYIHHYRAQLAICARRKPFTAAINAEVWRRTSRRVQEYTMLSCLLNTEQMVLRIMSPVNSLAVEDTIPGELG